MKQLPDIMDIYGSEPPDYELEQERREAYESWVESEIDRIHDMEWED